ncbi:histidinol-phosphate transaminase [Phlyctochytrium bullatum]|nr:histidinol-phosphate transaminase [Phlyctochytrium bullatum]
MYSVCAQVNDIEVVSVPLDVEDGKYALQTAKVKAALEADPAIKIVFLCSPGNPTGTMLAREEIEDLLDFKEFKGIVVVDEAYVDFCPPGSSLAPLVSSHENLVITQTLSKSFGLAGIRLGITIASPELTAVLNKTKAPYNISSLTSKIGIAALSELGREKMRLTVEEIIVERDKLVKALKAFPFVGKILGSNQANFVLAQIVLSYDLEAMSMAVLGVCE